MTLARDATEALELRAALDALEHAALPVFVTDGGSTAAFADELEARYRFFRCEARRGLWPQIRESLRAAAASGARFILYTEPDKRDFFLDDVRVFIEEASDASGIILASRSPETYATFPSFQQYTESVINRCCGELLGQELDYSYGPFLLRTSLLQHLNCPDDIGWGWRQYAFAVTQRLGLRIDAVPRGHACPESQRHDSAPAYRMKQMVESVRGLLQGSQPERNEAPSE